MIIDFLVNYFHAILQVLPFAIAISPLVLMYMLFIGKRQERQFAKEAADDDKNEHGLSDEEILSEFYDVIKEIKTYKVERNKLCALILPINVGPEKHKLNCSSIRLVHLVAYRPVWLLHFGSNPEVWKRAFIQTVGHELGHWFDVRKTPFLYWCRPKLSKELFCWVREVRNDFWSLKFLKENWGDDYCKKQTLEIMTIKASIYDPTILNNQHEVVAKNKVKFRTHPSWSLRLDLLNEYDEFSSEVIDDIAASIGCKDENLIRKLKILTKV